MTGEKNRIELIDRKEQEAFMGTEIHLTIYNNMK